MTMQIEHRVKLNEFPAFTILPDVFRLIVILELANLRKNRKRNSDKITPPI